jgi:hypothetical protein
MKKKTAIAILKYELGICLGGVGRKKEDQSGLQV